MEIATMKMLWQLETKSLTADIATAVDYYQNKYGRQATVVYVRNGEQATAPAGVTVETAGYVTAGTIQVQ
jgi:hypothetical protein